MDVVAGKAPFEFVIEGLDQESSESAGYGVRVTAANSAGYGRPSATLNIKVISDAVLGFGLVDQLIGYVKDPGEYARHTNIPTPCLR